MHTVATTALADGWITTGRTLGNNLESLLLDVAVPLMAVVSVLVVWVKTRSAPAAIVAVVLAAIVIWGATNLQTLSDKTGQDVNNSGLKQVATVVGPVLPAGDGGTDTGAGQR